MGNCCGQATNETEFVLWSPALEKLEPHRDPHRRALEAKTMQQIPKAGRSCFVCYTCAAPDQVRKHDIRLQAPPPSAVADIVEMKSSGHSNRLLGRMT